MSRSPQRKRPGCLALTRCLQQQTWHPELRSPPSSSSPSPVQAELLPAQSTSRSSRQDPRASWYAAHFYFYFYFNSRPTSFNQQKRTYVEKLERSCQNCRTTNTPCWRRGGHFNEQLLCNRCGLFWRDHQSNRPASPDGPMRIPRTR